MYFNFLLQNIPWKIKVLKTKNCDIKVGVSPIDIDLNPSSFNYYGWYFSLDNACLYSGRPYNYNGKKTNLKEKSDEILIVMDIKKNILKFIIDNEDKGESYNNIPTDKPLYPAVFLYNKNDSVEISDSKITKD